MRFRYEWLGVALVTLVLFPYLALSADGTATPAAPAGRSLGGIIIAVICWSKRKEEIGGWLLYYYIQLYIGVIVSLGITAVNYQNYLPETWVESRTLYPLFLITTIPGIILAIVLLVVSEKLRRSRNVQYVRVLRYVLWASLLEGAFSILIDSRYFPDSLFLDVLPFIGTIFWLPYFYISKRVKRVFVEKFRVA
ncbi:MAG: DUF2569 family protein [Nitrospiria bacterium]